MNSFRLRAELLASVAGTRWGAANPGVRAAADAVGIVRYAWPDEWVAPRAFDVFDPDGRYRGTVHTDGRFDPRAVDGVVWSVWNTMRWVASRWLVDRLDDVGS